MDSFHERLSQRPDASCDNRKRGCHGLQDHHRKTLEIRGEKENIGAEERRLLRFVRDRAEQRQTARKKETESLPLLPQRNWFPTRDDQVALVRDPLTSERKANVRHLAQDQWHGA